jgi:hypothetical protein
VSEPQSARGPIGWGDSIIAAKELGLQHSSDIAGLVDLLGLTVEAREAAKPTEAPVPPPAAPVVPLTADWTSAPPTTDEFEVAEDRRTLVEELDERPFEVSLGDAEPLAEQSEPWCDVRYVAPIVENQLRAAIAALAQRRRGSNRIDLSEAVETIAEQRPLDRLPFLDEPTTRMGITVVADASPAMMPYLADVDRFVAEFEHVVGSPNVTVAWLDEEGVETDTGATELVFEPNRPVVVVSTLGATQPPGGFSERMRWLTFAERVEDAEADVVALVPHHLPAWPDSIARAMRIVPWDDLPRVGRGRG